MKTLDKGADKINKICEALRSETIEPAKEEAQKIIDQANAERERILRQADSDAKELMVQTRKQLEQERRVFESSLAQAAKQSVESLRQEIERQLFNQELHHVISKGTASPQVVATLVEAIVTALAKEGLDAKLEALIPHTVKASEVNALLADGILQKLSSGVAVGTFEGGAKVRLKDKQLTIDISDQTIHELLAGYLREDFRRLFFA